MDEATAARIFRTLGHEEHLKLYRRLADAPGLPLALLSDAPARAALDALEAAGLARRNDGYGEPWYEADSALLVRALTYVIA